MGRPLSSIDIITKVTMRCFLNTFVCSLSIWEDFWDLQWGSKPVHGLKLEASCSRLMWISSLHYASCPEVYTVYFSQRDPHSYPNPCVCVAESGPREPRRHTFTLSSPSPLFSLELRHQKHMSLIKCSLRHWLVNTQLQENQQRAHSSSATLWLSECVIHYSVIRSLCFSSGPLANSEALGERDEGLCLHFV